MLALLAVLAAAQEPLRFESSVDVVYVDAFVTRGERHVPGLGAQHFEVWDAGRRQRVRLVESGELPLHTVLAFDTSGSVTGETLLQLKAAAQAFLDGLDSRDRVTVLTLSHDIVASAAVDALAAREQVEAIEPGGATALLDALYTSLRLADAFPGRPLVVLFTDGEDTVSWLPQAAVLAAGRESNAVVYVVAMGEDAEDGTLGGETPRDSGARWGAGRWRTSGFFDEIVYATGGRLLRSPSAGSLRKAFLEVLDETRTRYLLNFVPEGASRPGWHELKVRLRGVKGELRARRGYYRRPTP